MRWRQDLPSFSIASAQISHISNAELLYTSCLLYWTLFSINHVNVNINNWFPWDFTWQCPGDFENEIYEIYGSQKRYMKSIQNISVRGKQGFIFWSRPAGPRMSEVRFWKKGYFSTSFPKSIKSDLDILPNSPTFCPHVVKIGEYQIQCEEFLP